MSDSTPSGGRYAASFVWFGLAAFFALALFIAAFVVWLWELTGSFLASTLIVGGFFAVLAAAVYFLSVRDAVRQIQDQVETVYNVARLVNTGYNWLLQRVALFLQLHVDKSADA